MRKERINAIFILSCLVALAYQLLISFVIAPAFTKNFIDAAEEEAQLFAHHITSMVMKDRDTLPPPEKIGPELSGLRHEFHLERLKIFDAQGAVIFSTTPAEVGTRNEKSYFRSVVAQGQPYTLLVKKEKKTLEDRVVAIDVVETYVPVMRHGRFVGAVEIYYDITGRLQRHNHTLSLATTLPLALMFLFLLAVIVLLFIGESRLPDSSTLTLRRAQSPHFTLVFTLISIFVVEFLVMLFLQKWLPVPEPARAAVDALLLSLLITPLLYLFITRPLLRHIAERQQTEEALRESEERFRDLFDHTADLIQSIDPNGRFLYVNPAWRQTLGYSEEEVDKMTLRDILAPETVTHCQAAFAEVMHGKAVDRIETVFVAKDGRRVFVEGNASAKLLDGKPLHTRAIFHDITLRKEAEAEMERLINELQKSLAEVKTLSGLLPICSWCKKIRDDKGYWNQLESYISRHSGVDFSHSICPDCMRKHYSELLHEEEEKD